MEDCIYSQRIDKGLDHYLLCSKSGSYCKYQKYCNQKKRAVNTNDYIDCPLIKKEDTNMAKTTSTKKSSTVKPVKKTEVVVDTPVSEEKHSAYYDVLVATPNYYILNINGCPTKIFGANNYKKGDTVEK